MKCPFAKGDKKEFIRIITDEDHAGFEGKRVHAVYATFALARDFEWSSRLFFIDMMEPDEEGVGTFLQIEHKSPAFSGEEVVITATFDKLEGMELICTIEAKVGARIIATGKTGQKMLKREQLKKLFTKPGDGH